MAFNDAEIHMATREALFGEMDRVMRQNGGKLSDADAAYYDKCEAAMKTAHTDAVRSQIGDSRGLGAGVRNDNDPSGPQTVLRSDQSYAAYLDASMRNGSLGERRATATDFDTRKYWLGMATGNWSGAAAEQRASMQEGVNADGGYLVPSAVAGQFVDLLRSNIVFAQGNGMTIPWASGSTLSLPVFATDPAVGTTAETVEMYPPASDATVGRYSFTARPYSSIETLSWELLQDSAIDVGAAVQSAMAARLAVQLQSDFIYGSGAQTIQGFSAASGLLTGVEGGAANGAAPTNYDYIDRAIQAVRNANVDPDLIVTSPKGKGTYGRLKNTLNDAIRPSQSVQDFLSGANGKRFAATTSVSDTNTVGTATSNCSDLFVLDSSRIAWAIRSDIAVLPLKERFSTQRMAGILMWTRLDAVLTHAEAAYRLRGIVGN